MEQEYKTDSNLLIPAPQYFQTTHAGMKFLSALDNKINHVNIVAINVTTKDEIPTAIEENRIMLIREIEDLQEGLSDISLKAQLQYLETLQTLIENPEYIKKPGNRMLKIISRKIKMSVQAENVLYTSKNSHYKL